MAVKTSGQLSLRYDIAAEVNGSTSNIRLRTLSSAAGFGTPDAMSEFYGYSSAPPNLEYWLGRDTFFRNDVRNNNGPGVFGGLTIMGWFRPNNTTQKNQSLFAMGGDNRLQRSTILCSYIAGLNRIQVVIWDNSGVRRIRRQYPLHDSPNSAITGVTNSRTGWRRDQVGNVHETGMVHITAVWEGGPNSGDLHLYWNGQELTYSVNNQSTSVLTTVADTYISMRQSTWQGINTSVFDGMSDNHAFFSLPLSGTDILTIYNSGNRFVDNSIVGIQPLYSQGFEGGLTQQVIDDFNYNIIQNGSNGTFTAYPISGFVAP